MTSHRIAAGGIIQDSPIPPLMTSLFSYGFEFLFVIIFSQLFGGPYRRLIKISANLKGKNCCVRLLFWLFSAPLLLCLNITIFVVNLFMLGSLSVIS